MENNNELADDNTNWNYLDSANACSHISQRQMKMLNKWKYKLLPWRKYVGFQHLEITESQCVRNMFFENCQITIRRPAILTIKGKHNLFINTNIYID